jgi:hypothetical protein
MIKNKLPKESKESKDSCGTEDSSESSEVLKEDSVEVKGFSVKFKGMYTTTLIVLALVAMVWILQACTSTSTYTMNSTQIQNIDTNGISSSPEAKVETKSTTKTVNQIKLL